MSLYKSQKIRKAIVRSSHRDIGSVAQRQIAVVIVVDEHLPELHQEKQIKHREYCDICVFRTPLHHLSSLL